MPCYLNLYKGIYEKHNKYYQMHFSELLSSNHNAFQLTTHILPTQSLRRASHTILSISRMHRAKCFTCLSHFIFSASLWGRHDDYPHIVKVESCLEMLNNLFRLTELIRVIKPRLRDFRMHVLEGPNPFMLQCALTLSSWLQIPESATSFFLASVPVKMVTLCLLCES